MEVLPSIRGLDVPVSTVLELLDAGRTAAEIRSEHTGIDADDLERLFTWRRDRDRRARAEARRLRGMSVERFEGFPSDEPRDASTISERLALTTALTRAAFVVSGHALRTVPRASWPGEVFEIGDGHDRRST